MKLEAGVGITEAAGVK